MTRDSNVGKKCVKVETNEEISGFNDKESLNGPGLKNKAAY